MIILHPDIPYMRFNGDTFVVGLKELIADTSNYIISKGVSLDKIRLLELGVFNGESTFMFSSCIKNIVTVDPWINGYDENDMASGVDMKKVMENFMYLNGASLISKTITHIRKTTDEYFMNKTYDKNFDIIYIDACHTYEQFSKDVKNSLNLNPYVIAGHDYTHHEPTRQVLKDIIPHSNIILYKDSSWVVYLK